MRIGIVSDIHGNASALERALEAIGLMDELWCVGDAINEFRFSNEVVALLRSRASVVVRGNHEAAFCSRSGRQARAAKWIDASLRAWLESWPASVEVERGDRRILLVHSTAWPSDGAYVCIEDSTFRRFGEAEADVVVYGHTHRAVVASVDRVLVVNPGSAGEPRLIDGRWVCSCAVYETGSGEATIIEFPVTA